MPKLFSIRPTLTIRGRTFNGIRGWAGEAHASTAHGLPDRLLRAGGRLRRRHPYVAGQGSSPSVVAHDFNRAALFVIVAGAIVSLGTAITGFWDWWKGLPRDSSTGFIGRAEHTQVWRTANWHMTVMLTVTAIA